LQHAKPFIYGPFGNDAKLTRFETVPVRENDNLEAAMGTSILFLIFATVGVLCLRAGSTSSFQE